MMLFDVSSGCRGRLQRIAHDHLPLSESECLVLVDGLLQQLSSLNRDPSALPSTFGLGIVSGSIIFRQPGPVPERGVAFPCVQRFFQRFGREICGEGVTDFGCTRGGREAQRCAWTSGGHRLTAFTQRAGPGPEDGLWFGREIHEEGVADFGYTRRPTAFTQRAGPGPEDRLWFLRVELMA